MQELIAELRAHEILGHTLAMPTVVTEEKETRQFPLPNAGVGSSAKQLQGSFCPREEALWKMLTTVNQKGKQIRRGESSANIQLHLFKMNPVMQTPKFL